MSEEFKKIHTNIEGALTFSIKKKMELLQFLLEAMSSRSRNSVKSILARGQVKVDGIIVKQFNHLLLPGQKVEIVTNKAAIRENTLVGLKIIYEDDDLIVIEKDAGLLSIASNKEKELTAHNQLMNYVRSASPQNRIFVVHRLDKDTSGVMMFAKSEQIKEILQTDWNDRVKERSYVALVEGEVSKQKDTITSWLRESKTRIVYSSYKKNDGLYAVTHYKKIQGNKEFSLLDVKLETGRKNQIRVHMKDIGHPVVGDKKYGSTKKAIGRLGLHAKAIAFIHPTTKKLVRFEAKPPKSFYKITR